MRYKILHLFWGLVIWTIVIRLLVYDAYVSPDQPAVLVPRIDFRLMGIWIPAGLISSLLWSLLANEEKTLGWYVRSYALSLVPPVSLIYWWFEFADRHQEWLGDLLRKVVYAAFILVFWAAVVTGPIWLGARTAEVYNIARTSDSQIVVFAPDQEVAEIAAGVLSFSILWAVGVVENLGAILAIILVNLLWAVVTNREHGRGWYAGTFAISTAFWPASFGLWVWAIMTWREG